jgi:uncharacterized protein YciI
MFVILLKFSDNRDQAGQHMEAHKAWLQSGFDDGLFLAAGALQPNQGGAIIADGASLPEMEARVDEDPFVLNQVVTAEILEIDTSRADPRLDFLIAGDGP